VNPAGSPEANHLSLFVEHDLILTQNIGRVGNPRELDDLRSYDPAAAFTVYPEHGLYRSTQHRGQLLASALDCVKRPQSIALCRVGCALLARL
jgi:hypothetical protein